ncbi:nucleotidyltransferase family protein [Cohnella silvisoli]|uniref:Nucleotidyltransferase family protein n=1 Tax=Cohnella silvisoli TaxID=2873699 RepID=A0ABV1KY53_9BACL|nr:nucleotidyltransferase family protein [Cohnella silvisoli]MCD9021835.1 nucleotidyltransferase family protein [Cohnella silvisoli]
MINRESTLKKIIMINPVLETAFQRVHDLGLGDYYIGAGCITQTVWNHLCGNDLLYGIGDIDIIYYDTDLSYSKENAFVEKASELFHDLPIKIDLKNQGRVHLWYQKHFGYPIQPYRTLEEAIDTWPTTATALGVSRGLNSEWKVYAPYGLNDLFGMIIRPNKVQITKEIYYKKVSKWIIKWPQLEIIPWSH